MSTSPPSVSEPRFGYAHPQALKDKLNEILSFYDYADVVREVPDYIVIHYGWWTLSTRYAARIFNDGSVQIM